LLLLLCRLLQLMLLLLDLLLHIVLLHVWILLKEFVDLDTWPTVLRSLPMHSAGQTICQLKSGLLLKVLYLVGRRGGHVRRSIDGSLAVGARDAHSSAGVLGQHLKDQLGVANGAFHLHSHRLCSESRHLSRVHSAARTECKAQPARRSAPTVENCTARPVGRNLAATA